MSSKKPNIAELVEQLPAADSPGKESKFTGPAWPAAEKTIAGILAGGRESLLELIGMIRDATGGGDNYKPGYALHCIAVHVGRPGMESQRKTLCEALASKIGGAEPTKEVQTFLIQELQWVGGPDVVKILGQQLHDQALCECAAQALIAIGDGAAAELRHALAGAKGSCRLSIVQALGAVRDVQAVAALKKELSAESRELRIAAGWALARIGHASAVEPLLKATSRADGWERIQLVKSCVQLADTLAANGEKGPAEEAYRHLGNLDGADEYIKELARQALGG